MGPSSWPLEQKREPTVLLSGMGGTYPEEEPRRWNDNLILSLPLSNPPSWVTSASCCLPLPALRCGTPPVNDSDQLTQFAWDWGASQDNFEAQKVLGKLGSGLWLGGGSPLTSSLQNIPPDPPLQPPLLWMQNKSVCFCFSTVGFWSILLMSASPASYMGPATKHGPTCGLMSYCLSA